MHERFLVQKRFLVQTEEGVSYDSKSSLTFDGTETELTDTFRIFATKDEAIEGARDFYREAVVDIKGELKETLKHKKSDIAAIREKAKAEIAAIQEKAKQDIHWINEGIRGLSGTEEYFKHCATGEVLEFSLVIK